MLSVVHPCCDQLNELSKESYVIEYSLVKYNGFLLDNPPVRTVNDVLVSPIHHYHE